MNPSLDMLPKPGPEFPGLVGAAQCPAYAPDLVQEAVVRALEPFGGLAQFVPPGGTILLKPNLVSPHPPEDAVTTHPLLVETLARLCFQAGAGRVWIGDSPAGAHVDSILWERTGMRAAAERSGAELRSFSGGEIETVPCGAEHVPVPRWLREVDRVISLPKLKTHALTGLTCAMKNVFGMVVGEAKSMAHARHPSPREMSAFLVEVYAALRPGLTVVDAVIAMEGEGPTNGRPRPVGLVLAGTDAVAIDRFCSRFLPRGERAVPMLEYAAARGVDPGRTAALRIAPENLPSLPAVTLRPSMARWLMRLPNALFKPATYFLAARPRIQPRRCRRCGACAEVCSQNAIAWNPARNGYQVDDARCILCMCCLESCPHQAIDVRSPLIWLSRLSGKLRYGRSNPAAGESSDGAGEQDRL